ncbi:MAG: TolC family outer membrane protein [Pseudomonadota bacterium]
MKWSTFPLIVLTGILLLPSPVQANEAVAQAEAVAKKSIDDVAALLRMGNTGGVSTTLLDTLQKAYVANPEIQAAAKNVASVKENLAIADANFRPKLDGNADATYTHIESEGGEDDGIDFDRDGSNLSKTAGVEASQALYRGGRSLAEQKQAKFEIAAAVAEQKQTIQTVLAQAVSVHVDAIRQNAVLVLTQQNVARLAKQLDVAKLRFDVGELTRTDVAQAEARYSAAVAEQTRAQADLRTAQGNYRRVVGQEPVNLSFPAPYAGLPSGFAEAQGIMREYHPALQQAYFRTNAAAYQVRRVVGATLPTIGVQAGMNRTYDPVSSNSDHETVSTAALVASIPLYAGGANIARIRQSKADAARLQQNERATLDRLDNDLRTAWESYSATRSQMAARESQLAAASLARTSIELENQVGQRTVIDVLDAEQDYLQAQIDLVTTQRDSVVNSYDLAAAIGIMHPVTLGVAPDFPEAGKIIRN